MSTEDPSILELIVGGLILLLLMGWLFSGPGKEKPREEVEQEPAPALREETTQELEAHGLPRAAAWSLSYFIAGDVVTEKLLPGITLEQALLLHKVFPDFTNEWNGLWRLVWRRQTIQYILDPVRRNWSWSDLLAGRIWIGMPPEQVLIARGRPTMVNRTITAHGTLEQWVYEEGKPAITFPNAMQDPVKSGTLLRKDMLGVINGNPLPFPLFYTNTFYLYFEAGALTAIQD